MAKKRFHNFRPLFDEIRHVLDPSYLCASTLPGLAKPTTYLPF